MAVGAYAAVAAAFLRNFSLTTYADRARWYLVPLWPILLLFSPSFRTQFIAAVKGMRAPSSPERAAQQEGQQP